MRYRCRLLVSVVAVLGLAAGCTSSNESLAADVSDAEADFGPLALYSYDQNGDEALAEGLIEISENCVLLNSGDQSTLLLWSARRTTWDPANQAVIYKDRDGNEAVFKDGDSVAFGGGESQLAKNGESVEKFLESTDWVNEPQPECLTGSAWGVGALAETNPTSETQRSNTGPQAITYGVPYQATEAFLDGQALTIGPESLITFTFRSQNRLAVTYGECSFGEANYSIAEGLLVTSDWEVDAVECLRATAEAGDLLNRLFNQETAVEVGDKTIFLASDDSWLHMTPEEPMPPVPPMINAQDLRDADSHVELPQLVGLTEAEARNWAEESGFVDVVTPDEEVPMVLVPWERVTLSLDNEGIVTAAVAG